MTVYELIPDSDSYHDFALVKESDSRIYPQFDGRSLRGSWEPLEITAADTDDELALLGDYALLGTIPVVSERAVAALGDLLASCGELLPLAYPRQRYFAYNVTTVLDALDEERSKLTRFSSGRVMSVDAFEFRRERISGHAVFKIPQVPRARVFVTDGFVDRVRSTDLTGFMFEQVWRDRSSV